MGIFFPFLSIGCFVCFLYLVGHLFFRLGNYSIMALLKIFCDFFLPGFVFLPPFPVICQFLFMLSGCFVLFFLDVKLCVTGEYISSSAMSSIIEFLLFMSSKVLVKLISEVFVWLNKLYFSNFISIWVFCSDLISTFMSWTVFLSSSFCFIDFIKEFIHTCSEVIDHIHNCYFEVHVLWCFS